MGGCRLLGELLEARRLLDSQGWDGPGAGSASLSYYIHELPDDASIDDATFRAAIETAFAAWTRVVDLEIRETATPRRRDSIDISMVSIDGPGDTLAQAYLPDDVNPGRIAGDIQFDADDEWEVGNARRGAATDLVFVAVHEIGHALGLEHSGNRAAVMYKAVSPNVTFQGLHANDIQRIRKLYAPRPAIPGDFDDDGLANADDVDLICQEIRLRGDRGAFDLTGDGLVTASDYHHLIDRVLGTSPGDANLDGVFDTDDLLDVFAESRFEDGIVNNATWATGDWNCDGEFDSNDLLDAFAAGRFLASSAVAAAVDDDLRDT